MGPGLRYRIVEAFGVQCEQLGIGVDAPFASTIKIDSKECSRQIASFKEIWYDGK